MSNEKKLCAKRLVIFLLLAFGLAWIPWIILNRTAGYEEWFSTNHYSLFAIPTLYAPALANLLTRLMTKEGFSDMKLHLRLKGHLKYYLIAWLVIPAVSVAGMVIFNCVSGHWDFAEIADRLTFEEGLAAVLSILSFGPLAAFNTFGEEFGWRAYMNQKMEPLLGTAGTVITGGILWGIWHAPLTVEGHNFGKDYPGYPYLGFLQMIFFCTAAGAVFMWLTKRTDSVYPAAIAHAVNNSGGAALGTLLLLNGVGDVEQYRPGFAANNLMQLPLYLLGIVMLILMLREKSPRRDSVPEGAA